MSIAIIGIDPGVTTGLAVLKHNSDTIEHPYANDECLTYQLSYGGSGNASDLVDAARGWKEQYIASHIGVLIVKLLANYDDVYVAIEDFIIRQPNKTRDFLSPVRITSGILQEIYRMSRVDVSADENVKVKFQSPSDAKSTITDERLDKWGFQFNTDKDRHAKDAVRHALLLQRRLFEKGL